MTPDPKLEALLDGLEEAIDEYLHPDFTGDAEQLRAARSEVLRLYRARSPQVVTFTKEDVQFVREVAFSLKESEASDLASRIESVLPQGEE